MRENREREPTEYNGLSDGGKCSYFASEVITERRNDENGRQHVEGIRYCHSIVTVVRTNSEMTLELIQEIVLSRYFRFVHQQRVQEWLKSPTDQDPFHGPNVALIPL